MATVTSTSYPKLHRVMRFVYAYSCEIAEPTETDEYTVGDEWGADLAGFEVECQRLTSDDAYDALAIGDANLCKRFGVTPSDALVLFLDKFSDGEA